MRRVGVLVAVVAVFAVCVPQAGAQSAGTIGVSPTTVRVGEAFTVTGDFPSCAEDGYAVSLAYTDHQGNTATSTVNGVTDAAGHFTQVMTMPEAATAHRPASVRAIVADCSGSAATSNTVAMTVAAHQGSMALDRSSAPPGTEVGLSGSNCFGGEVDVRFVGGGTSRIVNVTLLPDRTFSGVYTIPEGAAPGGYEFQASCPGTDYASVPFQVESAPAGPAEQPPPRPPSPPPPPPDFTNPGLTLDFDPSQELPGPVVLRAFCDERCAVVAKAKLKTAIERDGDRVRANYTIRKDGVKLNTAGASVELELTLTKKAKKKARSALDSGGSAKAKGLVTATDESFNVTKQRFEIELG